jgi:hypothetical protein
MEIHGEHTMTKKSTTENTQDKKTYTPPELVIHGSMEKLTQDINIVGGGDLQFSVLLPSS